MAIEYTEEILDMVTDHQQAEALENAIGILSGWTELAPLARPLEDRLRQLTSKYTHNTDDTDHTADADGE